MPEENIGAQLKCKECDGPCEVIDGVSYHLNEDGENDYDVDADHVAIPDWEALAEETEG